MHRPLFRALSIELKTDVVIVNETIDCSFAELLLIFCIFLRGNTPGRTLGHVLSVLKDIDRPAYDGLAAKFRHYAACVGVVDTSYFRRRRAAAAAKNRRGFDQSEDEWGHVLTSDWLRGSRDYMSDLADGELSVFAE